MPEGHCLDPGQIQLGKIVRTSEGVYTNPPKDAQGNFTNDEKTLKGLLNKCKKVNGIYLSDNDFGFAPYETFEQGTKDCDAFVKGGLARLLEHTKDKEAKNLRKIVSPKPFNREVNVWGFEEIKPSFRRVVSLGSYKNFGYHRLDIFGGWTNSDCWGGSYDGHVFGVLNETGKAIA